MTPSGLPLLERVETGRYGVGYSFYVLRVPLEEGGAFETVADGVQAVLGEEGVRDRYAPHTAKRVLGGEEVVARQKTPDSRPHVRKRKRDIRPADRRRAVGVDGTLIGWARQ